MSLKQKFFSGLTFVFAVVAFTTFVSAQDNGTTQLDSAQKQERGERRGFRMGKEGKRGGHHGDKMMMHGLGRLNLSDAQREQIRTINENFKTATQSQREEMRGLMQKKRDGVITADETARLKELKTQLKTSGEQTRNSVLAVLTPEQRTQLEQEKEQMQQRMKERQEMRQKRQDSATPQSN